MGTERFFNQESAAFQLHGTYYSAHGAHLRWFIVSEALHGSGIGQQMMDAAMDFCKQRECKRIYLWTFEGLFAARRLYEKAGFKLVMQSRGKLWGTMVIEQRLEWNNNH